VQLRDEIRKVQIEVGTTTLFVTHDQEEALAVADRVGVMKEGRLEQIAPPTELYARPATRFVAEFVGLSNRLRAHAEGGQATVLGSRLPTLAGSVEHGEGLALIRPEAVQVDVVPEQDANARVISVAFLGPVSRLHCRADDGQEVLAQAPSSLAERLAPESPVRLTLQPVAALVVKD